MRRSKTFNITSREELNKAYNLLNKVLKKDPNAHMESYRVGKNMQIPRAVVYWTEKK